jgi:hypothetical protein
MKLLVRVVNNNGVVTVENHKNGQLETVEPGTSVNIYSTGCLATLGAIAAIVALLSLVVGI